MSQSLGTGEELRGSSGNDPHNRHPQNGHGAHGVTDVARNGHGLVSSRVEPQRTDDNSPSSILQGLFAGPGIE